MTEGFSFTFKAPLKTSTVADNSDTDIDESSDSESSSAAELSLAEVQNINSIPMLIDTSDDEEEKGKMTSPPSMTMPKPILK